MPVTFPSTSRAKVMDGGDIVYSEFIRDNCHKMEAFPDKWSGSSSVNPLVEVVGHSADLVYPWKLVRSQPRNQRRQMLQNQEYLRWCHTHTNQTKHKSLELGADEPRPNCQDLELPSDLPPFEGQIPLLHHKREFEPNRSALKTWQASN